MTEQEKDELFADFMVQIAKIVKDEERLATAKNNSAMTGLTNYFNTVVGRYSGGRTENNEWLYRRDETGRWYFVADGIYDAYCTLRKAVPYIVGAKKSLNGEKERPYKKQYVLDPEKDREEATKIGKMLINTMIEYLKEGK